MPELDVDLLAGGGAGGVEGAGTEALEEGVAADLVEVEDDGRLRRVEADGGDGGECRGAEAVAELAIEGGAQRGAGEGRGNWQVADAGRGEAQAVVGCGDGDVEVGPEAGGHQRCGDDAVKVDGEVEGDGVAVDEGTAETAGDEALGGGEDGVDLILADRELAGGALTGDEAAQGLGDVAGVAGGAGVGRAGVGEARAGVEREQKQRGGEEQRRGGEEQAAQQAARPGPRGWGEDRGRHRRNPSTLRHRRARARRRCGTTKGRVRRRCDPRAAGRAGRW